MGGRLIVGGIIVGGLRGGSWFGKLGWSPYFRVGYLRFLGSFSVELVGIYLVFDGPLGL